MKKKILRVIGILGAVMMLTAGCSGNQNPGPFPQEAASPQSADLEGTVNLTAGRTGFDAEEEQLSDEEISKLSGAAFALLDKIAGKESGENVLLSPLSVDFSLGMTENGAAGDTLAQMEQFVNGGISSERMNPLMKHMMNHFEASDDVKWNIANSVWFKNDGQVEMKEDFLNRVVSFYDAEVFLAPFNEQTITDINIWTEKQTDGMIPEILDSIPENTRMYLINAIAFDGEWETQYEEERIHEDREFLNSDGSISKVTMLGSDEGRYFTIADAEGFIKPYKGSEYSFVGILPKEGETPEELIRQISDRNIDFADTVRNADFTEVNVQIPEFTDDFDIELSETYMEMGMNLPFEEKNADFSNMMEPVGGGPASIWIGRILHKTFIDVNRKGTRAAAVTATEMRFKNAVIMDESKRICLDRPFVYAIVENETGIPVFLGYRNDMKE